MPEPAWATVSPTRMQRAESTNVGIAIPSVRRTTGTSLCANVACLYSASSSARTALRYPPWSRVQPRRWKVRAAVGQCGCVRLILANHADRRTLPPRSGSRHAKQNSGLRIEYDSAKSTTPPRTEQAVRNADGECRGLTWRRLVSVAVVVGVARDDPLYSVACLVPRRLGAVLGFVSDIAGLVTGTAARLRRRRDPRRPRRMSSRLLSFSVGSLLIVVLRLAGQRVVGRPLPGGPSCPNRVPHEFATKSRSLPWAIHSSADTSESSPCSSSSVIQPPKPPRTDPIIRPPSNPSPEGWIVCGDVCSAVQRALERAHAYRRDQLEGDHNSCDEYLFPWRLPAA